MCEKYTLTAETARCAHMISVCMYVCVCMYVLLMHPGKDAEMAQLVVPTIYEDDVTIQPFPGDTAKGIICDTHTHINIDFKI